MLNFKDVTLIPTAYIYKFGFMARGLTHRFGVE